MRIGVVSDTHGKPEFLRKALEQMGKIDLLLHAGDHYKDGLSIAKEADIRVIAVTGNCDWHVTGPAEEVLELQGFRILVTHGHTYGVKNDNSKLAEKLKKDGYDVIVYGHSHVPELLPVSGGYLLNPGSVSDPRRGSKRTYGMIEINKNRIIPYICELNW